MCGRCCYVGGVSWRIAVGYRSCHIMVLLHHYVRPLRLIRGARQAVEVVRVGGDSVAVADVGSRLTVLCIYRTHVAFPGLMVALRLRWESMIRVVMPVGLHPSHPKPLLPVRHDELAGRCWRDVVRWINRVWRSPRADAVESGGRSARYCTSRQSVAYPRGRLQGTASCFGASRRESGQDAGGFDNALTESKVNRVERCLGSRLLGRLGLALGPIGRCKRGCNGGLGSRKPPWLCRDCFKSAGTLKPQARVDLSIFNRWVKMWRSESGRGRRGVARRNRCLVAPLLKGR